MAAKKKTPSSHREREISKSHTYMEAIKQPEFLFYPGKDEWRERLCYTLLVWAEREESYELMQFFREYKIPKQTAVTWRQTYPDIAAAFEEAKLILGSKRRLGALFKKLDKDMVCRDLFRYDPDDDMVDKRNADLKKVEDKGNGTIIVNLPYPAVETKEELAVKTEKLIS